MNSKRNLRNKYLNIRRNLTEEFIKCASDKIMFYLTDLKSVKNSKNIFIYVDFDNEVKTDKIIKQLTGDGKNIYCPAVYCDSMTALKANHEMTKHKFGFLQPSDTQSQCPPNLIDIAVVPGVVFDVKKNRIGYGKGYYDRFLANSSAIKIGVCYSFQISDADLPINNQDILMDILITENGIIY